jgi:hypothetical protein
MAVFAAFMVALIVSLFFAPGYRSGTYIPLLIMFFILFFAGLAGQYWIVPFGPTWYGVSWGPILFIVLLVTLLFAAPSPYEERRTSNSSNDTTTKATTMAISIFVWLLFIMLFTAVLLGHYNTAV